MKYDVARAINSVDIERVQKSFLMNVYAWMLGGLLITAFTALFTASSEEMISFISQSYLFLIIAQFGLVIGLSAWIQKMSKMAAAACFLGYSFLTGLTFATIFLMFSKETIATTFFVTAGMFGAMTLYGAFTKKNISGWGSFLFMGLVGIIIAMVANMFLQSSGMGFLISFVGVIVFAGLTAYDTQKLKEMAIIELEGGELAAKGAIMGALSLYLDFINLFLMLLRLFGSRR